jgi:hypothetical protein
VCLFIYLPSLNTLTFEDLSFSRRLLRRMPSYGIFCRVALVRTDVSEQRIAPIKKVTRFGELITTLAVTSNRSSVHQLLVMLVTANVVPSSLIFVTVMMEALRSSETSAPSRATRRNIPENGIFLWLLVRKRNIPTERPLISANFSANFCG